MRKYPSVFKTVEEKIGHQRYKQFNNWIIEDSLTPTIKDFQGTIESDDKFLSELPEIDIPADNFYSEFAEILGTKIPTFARIEKQ